MANAKQIKRIVEYGLNLDHPENLFADINLVFAYVSTLCYQQLTYLREQM